MNFSDGRLSDEETAYWVAFDALPAIGLGQKGIIHLNERFLGLADAWKATAQELIDLAEFKPEFADVLVKARKKIDPFNELESIRKQGVWPYVYADPFYPTILRHISNPPVVLYCKGSIDETAFNHAIGIVGTRKPTTYGQKMAKEFGYSMAQAGALVVSGMALGVDSMAHWGAIEAGGRTIAVLGCGPDFCYPPSNKNLYDTIQDKGGAIVSEYPPGIKPDKWRFPARNRIISGLAKCLLVVEAGETSGALITANLAFEQNREVFVVPGRLDSPMSVGSMQLVRKPMARIALSTEHILDMMDWVSASNGNSGKAAVLELFGREKEIFDMLTEEPIHFDKLCELARMSEGEMAATLTILELAGVVVRYLGDYYSKQPQNLHGKRT